MIHFILFQIWGKEIVVKNNMISLSLSYSPKDATLGRKFENLHTKYIRMPIENEAELLFEKAVKRYSFNCDWNGEVENAVTMEESNEEPLLKRVKGNNVPVGSERKSHYTFSKMMKILGWICFFFHRRTDRHRLFCNWKKDIHKNITI